MIRGWWNWKLRENESGVPGRRRAPAVAYPLQPRSVRRAATRRTRRLRELATSRRCRTLQSGPCPFNDPLGLKAAGGGKMSPRAQSPNLRSSCAEIKPAKRRSLNPSHPMGQTPGEARASGDPARTSTSAGRLSRSCAARVHGYEDVVREVTAHGPPPTRTCLRAKHRRGRVERRFVRLDRHGPLRRWGSRRSCSSRIVVNTAPSLFRLETTTRSQEGPAVRIPFAPANSRSLARFPGRG